LNHLGAVLLAAGGSTRLGQPKQLLEIEGQVLVRRQAELLLEQDFACVVVVTGSVRHEVEQALQGLDLLFVHNENWEEGMGGSLARGIAAMPERVRGALLLLCDQWRISAADLLSLAQAWRKSPEKAVTAEWRAQRSAWPAEVPSGPPVIFPRALFARLAKLQGDRGAQSVLKHYAGGTTQILMPNAAFDIDLPSDLPQWADC
jgi:molybdenum cofactor cytidylyltransferase